MGRKRKALIARLLKHKQRALTDFYFFCKHILGYDLMREHAHRKLCAFVTKEIERGEGEQAIKLILMPRGSFKSSIVTVGYTLYCLVKNPNMTIFITNETSKKAKDFLSEIKGHINNNEKFKALFGELNSEKKKGYRWREDGIDIATRTKISKDYSIGVGSTEKSATGMHYDLIIADDLIGKSNSQTPDQLTKVDEYVNDLGAVLNPDGMMILVGTRWHYLDLYGKQLSLIEELGEYSNSMVMVESAEREDGTRFFPERYSDQYLKNQRKKWGAYFYNCQLNNRIVDKESQSVKKINKYTLTIGNVPAKKFLSACPKFVTVDLAYTNTEKSDSTAILVNAVDPETGVWYIVHYDVFKTTDETEVIRKLFAIHKHYGEHKVGIMRYGIEANNYRTWLQKPLEQAMRKNGIYLPIDPPDGLKHYGKQHNKNLRLRKIAPLFNFGNCYIHEDMTELEDQLMILTYDGVKGHDDLLDALAMQFEIITWGNGNVKTRGENELEVIRMNDRQHPFAKIQRQRYGGGEGTGTNGWLYC